MYKNTVMMYSPQKLEEEIPQFIEQAKDVKKRLRTKKKIEKELSQYTKEIQWSGDGEESGALIRGGKDNNPSLLSFLYLGVHSCILPEEKIKENLKSYIENIKDDGSRYQSLSESEFYDYFFSHHFKWLKQEDFPWNETFIQGVVLNDEWNLIELIAEFETQFIHMYWGTGA